MGSWRSKNPVRGGMFGRPSVNTRSSTFHARRVRQCTCNLASGAIEALEEGILATTPRKPLSPSQVKEELQFLIQKERWNKEEVTAVLNRMKDSGNTAKWDSVPVL